MSYITTNRRNHRRHPLADDARLGSGGSSSGGMSIQPAPSPDDRNTEIREDDLEEYAKRVSEEVEADPDEEMADDDGGAVEATPRGAVEATPRLGQEADVDEGDEEDDDEDDDEPVYEILPVPSPGGAKTSIPSRGRVRTREAVTAAEPDGGGMSIMPVPTPGDDLDVPDDGVLQIGQFAIPKWSIYAGAAVGGGLLLWALLRR